MYVCIFSWTIGVVVFAVFEPSTFPFERIATASMLGILISILAAFRWPLFRWPGFLLLGILYAAWRAQGVLALQLPVEHSNRLFRIEGTVTSAVDDSNLKSANNLYSFDDVSATDYAGKPVDFANLSIRSYSDFYPQQFQRCQFFARLKAPVAKRNPGTPNRERGYFRREISALGYVVAHPANYCMEADEANLLERTRLKLTRALEEIDLSVESAAILKALLLAERRQVSESQWEVLRQTGTTHLMAISGLHITLSAGLFFYAARTTLILVFRSRSTAMVTEISLLASIIGASLYVALANFPLPAQRALVMVGISVTGLLFRKPAVSYRSLLWAAFVLLLIYPVSATSIGFWLSFAAVAILILMRSKQDHDSWLISSLRTHCFLSIGLLPISSLLTDTVPLAAPIANLIAVPLISLLVMPLVLLGALAACCELDVYVVFWTFAGALWEFIWLFLSRLADWVPNTTMVFQPVFSQLVVAGAAVGVMLVPIVRCRWIFILACISQLIFRANEAISPQEFRIIVLDVGQGLAVIAQTADHVLVYDTGPAVGGYSAAKAILAPALRSYGISKIDRLMISHGDNDHAGGYLHLRDEMEIGDVLVSSDQSTSLQETLCRLGQTWSWDGVNFDVLSPADGSRGTRNDLSCVLRVHSAYGSVLLPGDIERTTERVLVNRSGRNLQSDILIAPHHGSKTSSTREFVRQVEPRYVVFAAGFFNRFNFPHDEVVSRYLAVGAKTFITSEYGGTEFFIRNNNIGIKHERIHRRQWKVHAP